MTRVYEVQKPEYANLTVRVVESAAAADLLVYRNDQFVSQANAEAIWCFVKGRETAHMSIFFPPQGQDAMLRIAWVKTPSLAGWMRHHKLRGRMVRRYPEKVLS